MGLWSFLCREAPISKRKHKLKLQRSAAARNRDGLCAAAEDDVAGLASAMQEGMPFLHKIADTACSRGSIRALRMYIKTYPRELQRTPNAARLAAAGGHVGCLSTLRDAGVVLKEGAAIHAAANGQRQALKFLLCAGVRVTSRVSDAAIENAHSDCLALLLECGCRVTDEAVAHAARANHLACLRVVAGSHSFSGFDSSALNAAARGGHLGACKYIYARLRPHASTLWVCTEAAEYDRLEVLRWAMQCGMRFDESTFRWACTGRHGRIVRELHRAGCPRHPQDPVVRRGIAAHVHWPAWARWVRTRSLAFYWRERAGETSCGPGGRQRLADMQAYDATPFAGADL